LKITNDKPKIKPMTAQDAKNHMEDLKNELGLLLFHEQTLIREMELLKPKFESNIVRPLINNVKNMVASDLEIDVVPASMATREVIEFRKAYYYACMDLANTTAAIATKKEMYNTYRTHIKQDLDRQAKPCTDTMIYDKLKKAQAIKNLSPEAKAQLKAITDDLPKMLSSGKDMRITLYETLQNFVLQNGA